MEGRGKEKLYFPLLKSQKAALALKSEVTQLMLSPIVPLNGEGEGVWIIYFFEVTPIEDNISTILSPTAATFQGYGLFISFILETYFISIDSKDSSLTHADSFGNIDIEFSIVRIISFVLNSDFQLVNFGTHSKCPMNKEQTTSLPTARSHWLL